ncbi:LysM peptidoglycan-binding domain-containing protein [Ralstonia mojiangensis]|uniref:LysM peptidoglycan-binding domain-containing protein n=1 Tax=Ralstonia mojiangensis TaxID=2953895 RepID=A0AAE3L9F6_9RALS|nr:LysM peptidoglycan-binding domain-containing protein [Ralstonia mojiangensis]MCO5412031.1 LysM peptidoglycan-binding domain-containing protein [Ralstonia mojiangensis]MCT7296436.1 LysM peptidoglycan-binding domain-containing protein [Ralstonia mojiangensis]MCT7310851.1 LysM peptidoglycan-binding domain-containing protein [Ralstonia mojiangensis]MCT7314974.1 LysM peptidoglycan-binding domain-containing protein [Ralstonia mojiangensis]MCT7326166.1 LysM peptidoglycan-binding domain-containing 
MHSQPAMQTATKARQPYVCALSAVAAAALFCMGAAHAAERTVTPAQQAQAATAAQAGIPESELSATAPAQYTVRRGDTLWAISGKYLKRPYRWPELWGMNREQIRNPHLIYPGQILYLHHANGRAWLSSSPASADGSTVRLSPHTRVSGQDGDAISSIPSAAIEPFLTQPIVVDEDTLATPARIFSLPEGRVYLGKGETAYARGLPAGDGGQAGTEWQAYRPVRPLKDPVTGNVLGYEADFLGTLRVVRAATGPQAVTKVEVLSSKEEMGVGSQLMPLPPRVPVRYVPHAPEGDVHGAVAKVTGGVRFGGTDQVVVLNIGSQQGLEPGHVLSLARAGAVVKDATAGNEAVQLPAERYGLAFVFRVFPHVAYALVTDASNAVEVGDSVSNPMSPQP